ncbi:hypothetical protein B0J12DRAFT_765289 [Macrophomina phaseolina]|uniref:Cupin RmlC-type n=1 Tax=Macrophomina phaseolina TaxID=35725 RepID=A0ABQ8G243_9PEZI|nr:hypothetical protein B0J12DRAFT_765289 [Macrophomina phaseolina]
MHYDLFGTIAVYLLALALHEAQVSPEIPVALDIPAGRVNFMSAQPGEVLTIGLATLRILEDGSRTDNRLGSLEIILPPYTTGPPIHWHEMHDETCFLTENLLQFNTPFGKVDTRENEYVAVPIRTPHTFSNPTDVESRRILTCMPVLYVKYSRIMSRMAEAGRPLNPEVNEKAMARYRTITVPSDSVFDTLLREVQSHLGRI